MFLLPFHVIGCSHEANPADVVGRLRLSTERLTEALDELRTRQVPAVLLSTCHRTELYWWGDDTLDEWFLDTLRRDRWEREGRAFDDERPRLERVDADLAVRHLFAVASGMRSARFGEPEILGQVRRAWTMAREAGTAHGPIDGAFRQAIEAARHVRAAMGHEADASLGERVAQRVRAALAGRSEPGPAQVLVVGSGDAARGVLGALQQPPFDGVQWCVTSRTDARASALAAEFTCAVTPWTDHERALREADVVVFAVHMTSPLVGPGFAASLSARRTPALWVDLGVPGAVDPAFHAPLVELVSLAGLDADTEPEKRGAPWRAFHEARVRRAMQALQHELDRFARATRRHQLGARLGALEAQAVAVAAASPNAPVDEMARKVARLVLRELSRA